MPNREPESRPSALAFPESSRIPDTVPPDHRRFYALARIAFAVALGAHALFLVLFLLIGEPELALFNVVSVGVWGGCLYFHARGHYRVLGGPAFAELFAHATLCVVVLGTASGFHLYLLTAVALPFLVPFYGRRLRWGLAVTSAVAFAALLVYGQRVPPASVRSDAILTGFLAGNSVGICVVIAAVIATYENVVVRAEAALQKAYARTDALLHNILPAGIVARLKEESGTVAERHDAVSILFADLVGFTALSGTMRPEAVVDLLNRIFSGFDELVGDRPVEKIKTIGDAYMAVSGAPDPYPRHADALVDLALAMQERTRRIARDEGLDLQLRIGIHSGRAVAGVIGTQKLAYDLWGDTVNTAARMESCGLPNRIHVSDTTKRLLADGYSLKPRGELEVPGKGRMRTWLIRGRRRHGERTGGGHPSASPRPSSTPSAP